MLHPGSLPHRDNKRKLRVLSVLGQKPEMTGSGILVRELWRCGLEAGDEQRLIAAGYVGEKVDPLFGTACSLVTYSTGLQDGQLPFGILGMSDVMPYPTIRFKDATPAQIELHLEAFRAEIDRMIAEFAPDVIQLHHLWVLIATLESPRAASIPKFVTIHGTDLKQLNVAGRLRVYVERSIGRVDRFFAVSSDILLEACRQYGIPSEKIAVIGNGFNKKIFRTVGPQANCDGKLVLAAGKYVDWKGFKYLIRACKDLEADHTLVIAGTGPEAQKIELCEEAVRNGMGHRVKLIGHVSQDELAGWMRRADVFVMPSIKEPFGLVFLEALACGSPAISSDCGGPKDLLRKDGLANHRLVTLVGPLNPSAKDDEDRFVADLRRALERHLLEPVTRAHRRELAALVKGLGWSSVYSKIRREYGRAATRKLAESHVNNRLDGETNNSLG